MCDQRAPHSGPHIHVESDHVHHDHDHGVVTITMILCSPQKTKGHGHFQYFAWLRSLKPQNILVYGKLDKISA